MQYHIETSKDKGQTYTVLITSDDLELLEEIGESLDRRGIRWLLKDNKGNILVYSFIHSTAAKLLESME